MKKTIVLLVFIVLVISGYYFIQYKTSNYSGQGTFIGNLNQNINNGNYKQVVNDLLSTKSSSNDPKKVPLQQVNNLGYTFYLGQIDNTNNITDAFKNQITKIVSDAHFPKNILNNTPIVILNSLALTGGQYVQVSETALKVPDLTPSFLSEGGFYGTYEHGSTVIFINKSTITQNNLTDVLTHELGHAIGSKLTDTDWKEFYQLRNIPSDTARYGTNWNLSPAEDFAEVYKNTFTGIAVQTYYGLLLPTQSFVAGMSLEKTCGSIFDPIYKAKIAEYEKTNPPKDCSKEKEGWDTMECNFFASSPYTTDAQKASAEGSANANASVQSCRRGVMADPSNWKYGMTPYKMSVSQATKDFIVSIANRLNQE